MTKDEEKELLQEFERARNNVRKVEGIKGASHEAVYALLYDRLALNGIGNRRRLRKKYR